MPRHSTLIGPASLAWAAKKSSNTDIVQIRVLNSKDPKWLAGLDA